MDKFIGPDEQRRVRLKAQEENNRRALTGIGISTNTPPLVTPTMYRAPKPPAFDEPAQVINMAEWKAKRRQQ